MWENDIQIDANANSKIGEKQRKGRRESRRGSDGEEILCYLRARTHLVVASHSISHVRERCTI